MLLEQYFQSLPQNALTIPGFQISGDLASGLQPAHLRSLSYWGFTVSANGFCDSVPEAVFEEGPNSQIACRIVESYIRDLYDKSILQVTELPEKIESSEGTLIVLLSTMPRSFLELLKMRACRNAIMFNDELSSEQAIELIQALAMCQFP